MINNVDVSGCEFYDNYECNCHISECWEPEDRSKMMCKQVDDCYYKQLQRTKQELQKFQDMAKKGLEEFKDVGGCWGCGLQLQLNQDIKDFKQLKAEKQELKEEIVFLKKELECSIKLRKRIQNDLLKSDRINDNLEVENKRLKQQLAEIGKSWDEIQRLRKENKIITGMHNSASNRFDKIYQTLQEIREIAEKVMLTELCNSCDGCGLIYGCNDTACAYYQMEKILQKITKAEEE